MSKKIFLKDYDSGTEESKNSPAEPIAQEFSKINKQI
jgi:hypothetical protein